MKYTFETVAVALFAFVALLGAAFAHDLLFQRHMWVLFFVLLISTIVLIRRISFARLLPKHPTKSKLNILTRSFVTV